MIIYKYPITPVFEQKITMPRSAKILHVMVQGTSAFVWALVIPEEPTARRLLRLVATGQPFDGSGEHIGSFEVVEDGQRLMFHVFDLGNTPH